MNTWIEWMTEPLVIALLLSVASIGFVFALTMKKKRYGLLLITLSLGLLFTSHAILGLVSLTAGILLASSIVAFVLSVFGGSITLFVLGLVSLGASIFLASLYPVQTILAITFAVVIALIGVIIAVKVFGRSMEWLQKLVLRDATDTESGYVSNESRVDLLEKEGTTITPLRPAGIVTVDGERLDVVSDGAYVEKDCRVRVVKVEGSKIVVTEI